MGWHRNAVGDLIQWLVQQLVQWKRQLFEIDIHELTWFIGDGSLEMKRPHGTLHPAYLGKKVPSPW